MLLTSCRRTVLSASIAAFAAATLFAAPASSAAAAFVATGCPDVPMVQPFAAWQDFSDYLLAPDGDFEGGATSWALQDGARTVEANEPFRVGNPTDHRALMLPAGATATTAPMCIGVEHRTMRFFGTSTRNGALKVEALYTKRNGNEKSVTLGSVRGADWAPSEILPMRVNELADDYDNAMSVSLRFTAKGDSAWTIDDVYVDPFRGH